MPRTYIYRTLFGARKSKWIKVIIIGGFAFFFFFKEPYFWLTDNVLTISWIGLSNIPAKILSIALALIAWDCYLSG